MNNVDQNHQNQGTWAEPSQLINSTSATLTADNAAPYGQQQSVSAQQPTNNAMPHQPVNSAPTPQSADSVAGGISVRQPVYSAINGTAAQQPATPLPYTVVRAVTKPEDTEETKRLKQNYGFFGPAAFLYAVFYAFCMLMQRNSVMTVMSVICAGMRVRILDTGGWRIYRNGRRISESGLLICRDIMR